MHLLEAAGRRVLLDCGLVHGPHPNARPAAGHFPFEPREIDAAHAPKIFCRSATEASATAPSVW